MWRAGAPNESRSTRAADYRDFIRPPGGIRNEDLILDHVRRIARVLEPHDDFTVILGGDCSVLLGSLLGLSGGRNLALVYVDGHDDFNTEETTITGGVAGMCLAQAIGRGSSELAHLRGSSALVQEEDVVAVGIRENRLSGTKIRQATTADEVLAYLGARDFFVHVDVDVLDPSVMPFVDSPIAGGLTPDALTSLLTPLARHPRAVGLEMTIYDPRDDHDSRGAKLLTDILESALTTTSSAEISSRRRTAAGG